MQKLGIVLFILVMSFSSIAGESTPLEVVKEASDSLTGQLKLKKDDIAKNPTIVLDLVKQFILPKVSTGYIAKSVLGNHYSDATTEQKQKFKNEFEESLLRFYAKAFKSYTDETIAFRDEILQGSVALVRTEIMRSDSSIPVDYKLRQKKDGVWLLVDIIVEGVSLVTSNRKQYDSEISRHGLDDVIIKLAEKNKQKF
jgi:phospholipid transport system substrate-binding protein